MGRIMTDDDRKDLIAYKQQQIQERKEEVEGCSEAYEAAMDELANAEASLEAAELDLQEFMSR